MIKTESRDQILFLTPNLSRLDAAIASEFRREACACVAGHAHLVLLMNEVTFVDSTGLGTIVALLKQLPPGGSVRLVGVHERVAALLRLTRLDRVFRSFESVALAVAA